MTIQGVLSAFCVAASAAYGVIAVSTLIGMLINFAGINPITSHLLLVLTSKTRACVGVMGFESFRGS